MGRLKPPFPIRDPMLARVFQHIYDNLAIKGQVQSSGGSVSGGSGGTIIVSGSPGASVAGIRAGTASLTAGANNVAFSSALLDANFALVISTYNSSKEGVGYEVTGRTLSGFDINVSEDCTLEWFAASYV